MTVSATWVRKVRKEALWEGRDVVADHLLSVMKQLQAGDYNGAISYAKEHGFDLEAMKYERRSGVLESNWRRMVDTMRVWGTRPEFVNMEKPLYVEPGVISTTKHRKYEADTPYKR